MAAIDPSSAESFEEVASCDIAPLSAAQPSPSPINMVPVRKRWHRTVIALLLAILLGYSMGIPAIEKWAIGTHTHAKNSLLGQMSFAESVRLRSTEALIGLWFLTLGGTIGSFLNVVVYRMPRGRSIVTTPSSCPKCGTPIRLRDNVPILGWLALGGRCRDCKESISIRYPVVEGMMAVAFWLLFAVQLTTGGANLPLRSLPASTGIQWIVFHVKWDIVFSYAYHCTLFSSLLVFALVDIDRQRVTWAFRLVVCCLLILPPILQPDLLPVPLWSVPSSGYAPDWIQSLTVCLVGAFVGGLLGLAIAEVCQLYARQHLVSAWCLVGMGLGWQAAVALTLVALFLACIATLPLRIAFGRELPLTGYLLIGFILHHVFWRWSITHLSPWWPGPHTTLAGWMVVLSCLLLLLFGTRWVTSRRIRPDETLAIS